MTPATARYAGLSWMLLAAVGFAAMGTAAKLAGTLATAPQLVFMRSALGALLTLACMLVLRQRPDLARWRSHGVRATAGTLAMGCQFAALALVPVSTAMALNGTSALFLTALAWVLLAERPSMRTLAGLASGSAGILVLLQPGHATGSPLGAWLALLSGLLLAVAQLSIRRLGRAREPVFAQVFTFNLLATFLVLPVLLVGGQWPLPTAALPAAAVMAVAATLGQYGLVSALAVLPAAGVAALAGVPIGLAALADWGVFGNAPAGSAWLAFGLIVLGAWLAAPPTGRNR